MSIREPEKQMMLKIYPRGCVIVATRIIKHRNKIQLVIQGRSPRLEHVSTRARSQLGFKERTLEGSIGEAARLKGRYHGLTVGA